MNMSAWWLLVATLLVIGMRAVLVVRWMRSLVALRVTFPADLTTSQLAGWWSVVQSGLPVAGWWRVCPLVWEITGTSRGIEHVLVMPSRLRGFLLPALSSALPGVRVVEVPEYLTSTPMYLSAVSMRLSDRRRPLATGRADIASGAVLSALGPVTPGESVRVSWVLSGAPAPRPVVMPVRPSMAGLGWWQRRRVEYRYRRAQEFARARQVKQDSPLLMASLRVGVVTPRGRSRAVGLVGRVTAALGVMDAPGCRVTRQWLPSWWIRSLMRRHAVPLVTWPVVVNTAELAGLSAVPLGGVLVPGLPRTGARQLPPPDALSRHGAVIGVSNYPGMTSRTLALGTTDRVRHTYVVGPSGSGKSVLLTRLIVGDANAGHGVVALDMKGDLIPDVLARLSPEAAERVLVVDAAAWDSPIGFNPLAGAHSEAERDLVTDGVVTVFRELWAGFWGPRSESVLRSCISTLLVAHASDGSSFTLCEVLPLLTDDAFRRRVITQPSMPLRLREWWGRYNALSDGERAQTISPLLNKVEAFTSRTATRLMLGQSTSGLDFRDVFTQRRVVLVTLAQGAIGTETSSLLGALLVFSLWRATLERVAVAPERRRPVFAYIDEAHTVVKLPVPLAEMLAQARGFNLGLTLANQYVAQLPAEVRAAVLGTVRTQITFAPQYDDARILSPHFPPLTAGELSGLAAFEFAMRPCIGGGTGPTITGVSLPLPDPIADATALALASRMQHGTARNLVEAALEARVHPPKTPVGSRTTGRTFTPPATPMAEVPTVDEASSTGGAR